MIFNSGKYSHDFITQINTNVTSFDHKFYICKTCNAFDKKKELFQAAVNGLQLENVPEELDCLNTLEVILTAKRLLFKKIAIKDQSTDTKN